jgi:hypothetical protein
MVLTETLRLSLPQTRLAGSNSLPAALMKLKITPKRLGIRGLSDKMQSYSKRSEI